MAEWLGWSEEELRVLRMVTVLRLVLRRRVLLLSERQVALVRL